VSLVKLAVMFAMYSHYSAGQPVELPRVDMPPVQQEGVASWYGNGAWHGDMTANGEHFNPEEFTCAHRSLPFDTMVLVVDKATDRRVWCRVNDRGPYGARLPDGSWGLRFSSAEAGNWRGILDLSEGAARALGTHEIGLQQVELRYWPPDATSGFNLAAIVRPLR